MLEDSDVTPLVDISLNGPPVTPVPPTVNPKVEPKVEAPKEPEKPSHPDYLRQIARNFGFLDSDIDSVGTPELERVVALASKSRPQEFIPQPQPKVPEPEPEEVIDWDKDEDGKPYTEDQYAAPIRNSAKEAKALKKEVAELKKLLIAQTENQIKQTRTQMIDQSFADLGKDYQRLFGKGSIAAMKDDLESAMRNTALSMAGVPVDHPEYHARLRKAADKLLAKFVPVQETNGHAPKNRITEEEWDQGALAATTQRKSPQRPKSRFEEVLEEVRAER